MPKFVIERELPGARQLTTEELEGISARSNVALNALVPEVQWVQSYVTDGKLFCVYNATDESLIEEHARRGGFPCDRISRVTAVIDPVTGGV